MNRPIIETDLPGIPKRSGKVRDLYDFGDCLLLVATDRISAFDQILPDPIPDKGKILTALAAFWFKLTGEEFPNHLITTEVEDYPEELRPYASLLRGRSMLVKKGIVIPVECVVRGYLAGSGWREYRKTGEICGVKLPAGLQESDKLPEPLFTPTTKAQVGHDQPLTPGKLVNLVGSEVAAKLEALSLALYRTGAKKAEEAGIIIADTKFEFAWVGDELMVVDEIFTPDSSRFWPLAEYQPGKSQPSFDKQYIRDYLVNSGWDFNPPAPHLPAEVINKTREKYLEAYQRLTGKQVVCECGF